MLWLREHHLHGSYEWAEIGCFYTIPEEELKNIPKNWKCFITELQNGMSAQKEELSPKKFSSRARVSENIPYNTTLLKKHTRNLVSFVWIESENWLKTNF